MRCAPRFGSKLREEASLSPESINKKLSAVQGVSQERLKGLEPSTFCMAIGMASAVTRLFYLQTLWILALITPGEGIRMLAN
jgi:hypothetical protein